jgi:glycosyltransferase involved in cell wall biosynthesis
MFLIMKSVVIIPAYNEEKSIAKVIGDIPADVVSKIIVINNNSSDNTETTALNAGAKVLFEKQKGYGAACLKGINYLKRDIPDIVVFLDGDYSDYPEEIIDLIKPIEYDDYDFVLGSRVIGERERGALPLQSRIGSMIAGKLIRLFWKVKYTDLGPFRAIKYNKLLELEMEDTWFGWTVEMQIRAAKKNYKILEIPVRYRKRIGKSKVTGTFKGSVMASVIIMKTIFGELFKKNVT